MEFWSTTGGVTSVHWHMHALNIFFSSAVIHVSFCLEFPRRGGGGGLHFQFVCWTEARLMSRKEMTLSNGSLYRRGQKHVYTLKVLFNVLSSFTRYSAHIHWLYTSCFVDSTNINLTSITPIIRKICIKHPRHHSNFQFRWNKHDSYIITRTIVQNRLEKSF